MRRTVVAAIGVVALLIAVRAAPASATFPGHNGAIIASYDDHSQPSVRSIDPMTGAVRVLFKCSKTDCPDFISNLGVSSDGRLAVFDGTTFIDRGDSNTQLSILTIATHKAVQLPLLKGGLAEELDQDASWLPGVHKLLFTIGSPNGTLGLFTATPGGAGLSKLISCGCGHAVVSPNGKQMLFERGNDLWIAKANGARAPRIARNAAQLFSPVWSPDGSSLAFASCPRCNNNDSTTTIYTVHRNGQDLHKLYTEHPGSDIGFAGLDWQALRR
jgi:hypothetical protein